MPVELLNEFIEKNCTITLMGDDMGCGEIAPKCENGEGHVYLSNQAFYPCYCEGASRLLQRYGFDVELVATPKKISSWQELVGLESENYKLAIDLEYGCGWIKPKVENEEFHDHIYLTTHTFYPSHYKWATETLQKYGFDVELVPDA